MDVAPVDPAQQQLSAREQPIGRPRPIIACIDGNSLMHRAFHAVPASMHAPDGRPTNAVFGFCTMLIKLIDSFQPDGLVVAFDKGKPKARMELLKQYKAQRPPMDKDLRVQFPMVQAVLAAMDVPVVQIEGWEGDDLLGTLGCMGEAAGFDMLIVTGDRDMYQLTTEHVRVVTTRKGMSKVQVMTPETVADLYGGITPELVPDFYGLKGDSSDNIPGVPGIGPKKAAALITKYGSLDAVIEHVNEIKGKMGENLRAHIDDALVSREVATIRTDAPISFDLTEAKFPTFHVEKLRTTFAELGFTKISRRMLALVASDEAASLDRIELGELMCAGAARAALEAAAVSGSWIGVSIEPGSTAAQVTLSFDNSSSSQNLTLWAATKTKLLKLEGSDAIEGLCQLLRLGFIASGDVKGLIHAVSPADSSLDECFAAGAVDPARIFDVGLAGYLLDSSKGSYPVLELAQQYLQGGLPEPTEELPEAALSARAAYELVEPLKDALEQDGTKKLFSEVEMVLVGTLARMERCGLAVDTSVLSEQSAELGEDIELIRRTIFDEAGEEFNIDSPAQLSRVLFEVLRLPTAGLKRTRTGFYSTNASVLSNLAERFPVVQNVLDYREKAKIRSTYLDALPALVAQDGRIHTTLNQAVTATGRLSSSNPNLQNIPIRSELGHRVRKAFTVPAGCVFMACDYSQIELRLLAHLSGDEHLVAAFCEGVDFHTATASRVFGVAPSEVSPELRSRAKAVNFGIVYGQQAFGLSRSLHISVREAQQMIDRYFDAYPGVRSFLDDTVAFARRHYWVATMYGRKRHIPDISSRNVQARSFAERTAMNHPMQGSAADIIKIAMNRVDERMRREGMKSKLVLQIHDELDFEVPEEEIEAMAQLAREEMEEVAELRVPLLAEPSWGATWAEAK